jgi:hypothetical protein
MVPVCRVFCSFEYDSDPCLRFKRGEGRNSMCLLWIRFLSLIRTSYLFLASQVCRRRPCQSAHCHRAGVDPCHVLYSVYSGDCSYTPYV